MQGEIMKGKILFILIILFVALFAFSVTSAGAKKECTTINSGTLYASKADKADGEPVALGFNEEGYNYQAHLFIGFYGNYREPPDDVNWGYRFQMKWNDAWLSNKDCDGDNILDKHYGFESYTGSGAWMMNHFQGAYEENGTICDWNKNILIEAVPEGSYILGGVFYTAEGGAIGPVTWQHFATTRMIYYDSCKDLHGRQ
jgi:hypothetical protein